MSCCGNHNHGSHKKDQHSQHSQHSQHGGNHKSHKWMMIICCVLPIVLAAVFFLTKGIGGPTSNLLPLFLILLCPLSHLVMMPLMNRKKKDHQTQL